MMGYISYFKIRFIHGLQYRAAALAGIATQLAWGFMYIMLYETFYKTNPKVAPMNFTQLSSYIWLQQAFLALFMTWFLDNDLFDLITSGNVAYELVRPLNLYNAWYVKNCAVRISKAVLRCLPILIIAFLLPSPYKFLLPQNFMTALVFILTMVLGFLVVVAYCMFIYIISFFTISPMGVRMVFVMAADFLSGGLVPLPFLPEWLTKFIYITPFAAMQNVPFRIYSGDIAIKNSLYPIILQFVWLIILVIVGKFIMCRALKKVIVQGG